MINYVVSTSEEKMTELENIINHHLIIMVGNTTKKVVEVKKHLTDDKWFLDLDSFLKNVRPCLKDERQQQIGEFVGDNAEVFYEEFESPVIAGFELDVD